MKTRDRLLVFALWVSVLFQARWFGGTLYQMLVIVPLWSASPPESVVAFFKGTGYTRTIWNFFGPPFMVAGSAALLLALIFGWHRPRHRFYLLIAVACTVFGLVYTLGYIYKINDVLIFQAGGNHTAEEIREMARAWVFADRVRFAVGIVGFLALLQAFRLPSGNLDGVTARL